MEEKEKKQYVSRRVLVNDYMAKILKSASGELEYNFFVGNVMKTFGVSERFVRDVLRAYEMAGDIDVNKEANKIYFQEMKGGLKDDI